MNIKNKLNSILFEDNNTYEINDGSDRYPYKPEVHRDMNFVSGVTYGKLISAFSRMGNNIEVTFCTFFPKDKRVQVVFSNSVDVEVIRTLLRNHGITIPSISVNNDVGTEIWMQFG